MTVEQNALVELAVEYWKLFKLAERTLANAQADKMTSVSAQLRYSLTRLHSICEKGGLRLISYDRDVYEPNLPVTVANGEDAALFNNAVIDRTVEPTIICDGQVVAMGKVFLKERA
jgi:hypothetical protein